MPQEDYSVMMIYNPSPSIHTKGGASINAVFAGWRVDFSIGAMCSFPYEAGKALLDRYPWLQLVKDHPSMDGKMKPLPSGVIGWSPDGVLEEKKEEPKTIYTSGELDPNADKVQTIVSLLTCPMCGKSTPTAKGMWLHKKRVHKIIDNDYPTYGNS